MARGTWNFQVHEARDWPSDPSGRGFTAGIFYTHGTSTTPFSTAFTAIFSVLIRTGWTSENGAPQTLFSLGKQGAGHSAVITLQGTGGNPSMEIITGSATSGASAYAVYLGDEDGTNWLSADKWYQFAFSCNSSDASFAVNGSSSPQSSVTVDSLANFDIANATRTALFGAFATNSAAFLGLVNFGQRMPSCMVGPAAYADRYIDLTDSTVLSRIYDSDGNFKNPGEDGSLWFGDTYGANQPEWYFATGCPRVQKGSDTTAWYVAGGNNYTGRIGGPGGLRKQYES